MGAMTDTHAPGDPPVAIAVGVPAADVVLMEMEEAPLVEAAPLRWPLWWGGVALAVVTVAGVAGMHCSPMRGHAHAGDALAGPKAERIYTGVRPLWLAQHLPEGDPLRAELEGCRNRELKRSRFTFGHRGAPLQFPEHSRESYTAAYEQGAGSIECDVTFTKDRELVCRHSECDLHTTTNILATPLAAKCTTPFEPARFGREATAKCCTSDLTFAEFKTLTAKMDGANKQATTPEEYMRGTPGFRTDLYTPAGQVMSHNESIELFTSLGVHMIPELKAPASGAMPADFPRGAFIDKVVRTYKAYGVPVEDMIIQSFELDDIKYLKAAWPEYQKVALYLDDRMKDKGYVPTLADLQGIKDSGAAIVCPPIYGLVVEDADNNIVESEYAKLARAVGLKRAAYSFERSGLNIDGDDFDYYRTLRDVVFTPSDTLRVLDVLKREVGVVGMFSDWPATLVYYDNCVSQL